MMRAASLLAGAGAGLLLAGQAACGGAGPPVSSATAGSTRPQASAPASPTTAPGPAIGGGGPTPARTPAPRPTASASPAASGLPEITSFTASPTCGTSGGTVSLSWASKNATEAWLTNPLVASAAGDPKTTAGAKGPLPPSGSTTMTFDCSSQYSYYDLGVYGGGHSAGEIKQVQRP